jgi:hypothetical protein
MKNLAKPQDKADRKHLVLLWFLGGFIFLLSACFIFAFSYAHHRREEFKQLISDMQQIKSGMNSDEELRTLSHKYGGTFYTASGHEESRRTDGRYELRLSGPFIVSRNHFFHVPGQRPWTVLATFDVNDGKLDEALLMAAVMRSDGVILQGFTGINFKNLFGHPEPSYAVLEPHITGPPTEAVDVHLRPGATPEQIRRAFDFNFQCLTGLRGCQHVCEFMPSAWGDLPLEKRLHHADGHENLIDSECRTALALRR